MHKKRVAYIPDYSLFHPDYQETPAIKKNILNKKQKQKSDAKPPEPFDLAVTPYNLDKSLLVEFQ
jgi:hypothetical protein